MRLSPLRYCGKVLRKSDFIKTEGVHQRVFRWGIGNRFRSANANRYQPVHLERIKEVTLNDDYYDSPDPNIRWDDYSECWEVYWYEHEKLNAKPFPVKKFGIKWSKEEAKKFYEELKESGRVHARPSHKGGDDSIMWDERMQGWALTADELGSGSVPSTLAGPSHIGDVSLLPFQLVSGRGQLRMVQSPLLMFEVTLEYVLSPSPTLLYLSRDDTRESM
ncbi:hypothetical protein FOZ63_025886, partial [Perkinsus olseni]